MRGDPAPVTRVVPSAAAAAAASRAAHSSSSLYGHVSSRLHEETVSTIAKKKLSTSTGGAPPAVGGGSRAGPGQLLGAAAAGGSAGGGAAPDLRGAVNLTALPPPGLHPMAMPLGTLLPPRYGVPGPLKASAFEVVPGEYFWTWGPGRTGLWYMGFVCSGPSSGVANGLGLRGGERVSIDGVRVRNHGGLRNGGQAGQP